MSERKLPIPQTRLIRGSDRFRGPRGTRAAYVVDPDHRSVVRSHSVLSTGERIQFLAIVSCWGIASFIFWRWWFDFEHVVGIPQFIFTTFAILYDLALMPLVFIFMIWKMKRPEPRPAPPGLRAAMVTAIVPASESIEVLERTLAAMTAVRYPHDNWVLDEGADPRVRALCARFGANYWSRKGVPEFNQDCWPHQAKTKSGNYNSWFADVAYERYDFIVQLDTDHAPVEHYLDDVLGYFDDPNIAYVALPSVYWNLDDWTARGSSEQSQVFQGPIQMGYYGWTGTPMIIGSHAAYRMKHLKEIGGFAPSRAEDHLDTLRFAQHGYHGVFVPQVLATGLGPHTLSDYMVQEHQWAFSIAQVLMLYGREKGMLTRSQRAVFLFSELWYGLYALTYLALFVLPLYALLTNKPLVSIAFADFMLYSLPVTLTALVGVAWGYRKGWYRPGNHFFLSWQGILLTAARWPIVLVAIFNAVVSVVFRNGAFTYMVTPKGTRSMSARDSVRIAVPFIVLAVVPIVVALAYPQLTGDATPRAAGYVLFALFSTALFTILVLTIAVDHVRTNMKAKLTLRRTLVGAVPLACIFLLLAQGLFIGGLTNVSATREALAYRPTHNSELRTPDSPQLAQGVASQLSDSSPILGPEPLMDDGAAAETATSTPSVPVSPVDSWLTDTARTGVTFGAYDPSGELDAISGLKHVFTSWAEDETGGIPMELVQTSYQRGVPTLLSYEPWPLAGHSKWSVLSDTAAGEYDSVIRAAAQTMVSLDQPILIRFGHEMDLDKLYPWSGRNPEKYIAAYQRVVTIFREEGATKVLWLWSPAGSPEAVQYYPGDAFVDYVGVTILEYTQWEQDAGYPEPRPIRDLFDEKYRVFQAFGKPIIVAELGVDLADIYKTQAIEQVINFLPFYPDIRAIVYFNDQNAVTPIMDERPMWLLSEPQRRLLIDALTGSPWIEGAPARTFPK